MINPRETTKSNINGKKNNDLHRINNSQEYTRSYDIRYVAEIRHKGLCVYRILKDKDNWILNNKVEAQFNKWDDQWLRAVNKNKSQADKEANQNLADEMTREAQTKLEEIENILRFTLDRDDTIKWEALKDRKQFKIPNPQTLIDQDLKISKLPKPKYKDIPLAPDKEHFQPKFSF